jgi:hypothetical protein
MAFLNINKSQGYGILKSDTIRTLNSHIEENPRGRPPKVLPKSEKKSLISLNTEPDV